MRTMASWLGSTGRVADETPTKLMSTIAATVITKIRNPTDMLSRRYVPATEVRTVLRRFRGGEPPRSNRSF